MKHLLTQKILQNNSSKVEGVGINKIGSIIASVFSVVFSLSIIKEAKNFIQEWWVLGILIVFVVLFLVYNEYLKVRELRSKFLGERSFLFVIVLTFFVSFGMSGVGIYFWTNHTLENEITNDQHIVEQKLNIENEYNHIIDSISRVSLDSDPIYNNLTNALDYWNGRSAASIEERTYIRHKIDTVQHEMLRYSEKFNQGIKERIGRYQVVKEAKLNAVEMGYKNTKKFITKGNRISFIFFILVIITELIIILLAREKAFIYAAEKESLTGEKQEEFLNRYRIVTEILSRKEEITYNDVAFSPFLKASSNELVKKQQSKNVYYFFGQLFGVTGESIKISRVDAQQKLTEYYETILNL